MAQPLTVSIPHRLGKDEATRRLQKGLTAARGRFADKLVVEEEIWTDSHLAFRIAVLGQKAQGEMNVAEDAVHLSVELPWFLQMMAQKAKDMIQKQGHLLLEKKS